MLSWDFLLVLDDEKAMYMPAGLNGKMATCLPLGNNFDNF